MAKYVAFLRAINVGGVHTVRMDQLRDLFTSLGFRNVETFIASGNVIFDAPAKSTRLIERKIEKHLRSALGYEVDTFVRTISELKAIAECRPFPEDELKSDDKALYIALLAHEPDDEAKQNVRSLATRKDSFQVLSRELYWLRPRRITESEVSGARLAKALGVSATMRNSTTIRKIATKYS